MLVLHGRLTIGRSLIWEGDTGVGKTELLRVLSSLANIREDLIPGMLELLQSSIKEVAKALLDQKRISPAVHLEIVKEVNIVTHGDSDPTPGMIRASELFGDAPLAADTITDAHGPFLQLAQELAQLASNKFRAYKKLDRTPVVSKLIASFDAKNVQPSLAEAKANPLTFQNAPLKSRGDLSALIVELLTVNVKGLFSTKLMSNSLTIKEIQDFASTNSEQARHLDANVIVFIDEENTTRFMGVHKEIICDHCVDGVPLHGKLFIVGAVNPADREIRDYALMANAEDNDTDEDNANFTGVKRRGRLQFTVRVSALSLKLRHVKFYEFTPEVEKRFMALLLASRAEDYGFDDETSRLFATTARDCILIGQQHLRDHRFDENIHVSIRDAMRALKLFRYFYKDRGGHILLRSPGMQPPTDPTLRFSRALTMALCITYYFRFPRLSPQRDMYATQIDRECSILDQHFSFRGIVLDCLTALYNDTELPRGTAPTEAILENLYGVVACVDAMIPFAIVGPAGCGKTFGFTIAQNNMKGKKGIYKDLYELISWRYQCSLHSTDREVKEVYDNAEARYFQCYHSSLTFHPITFILSRQVIDVGLRHTVLLDETSLPKDQNLVLKETHDHLDHPRVASVILSNAIMDVPNTNRVALLLQPDLTLQDLDAVRLSLFLVFDFFNY